jgi:hypothetical protein
MLAVSRGTKDGLSSAAMTTFRAALQIAVVSPAGVISRLAAGAFALALMGGAFPAAAQQRVAAAPDRTATEDPAAEPEGLLPEPRLIERGIVFADRQMGGGEVKNGFYPELSNMITGAGWIAGGPGYRHWLFTDRLFVDASAALSWRQYKMAQARLELPQLAHGRLAVGTQVRWQDLTQVTYFGGGPESAEGDRSEYRMKSTNVVGYATFRPARRLAIGGGIGWLDRPSLGAPAGSFRRGYPSTQDVFRDDPVFSLGAQPSYVHGTVSATVDTRDHRSHPSTGGLYRASWSAYSDRDAGRFGFQRYETEAAQFVPLAGARVVIALHGWLAASTTGDGQSVPLYLAPSLGGSNTLRAYSDYRFHDRNLLVLNAEGRVALFTHIDAALFVDAGSVAPRVGDLDLGRQSFGAGLRMHSKRSTFARVDVAHGDEGWRFLFRMNDPLHLARLAKRTAAAPFVP